MDEEEIERLVVSVRADTGGFARDVTTMREGLEGSLGDGAERAGRRIEGALSRAVRTGQLGFDDLRKVALSALSAIADAGISGGLKSVIGGVTGGGTTGGLIGLASSLAGSVLGLPGRATGGPVAPGRGYVVGERGPELFVPTASGRVETTSAPAAGPRAVHVSIAIDSGGAGAPQALAQSGRQVARAVRRALENAVS